MYKGSPYSITNIFRTLAAKFTTNMRAIEILKNPRNLILETISNLTIEQVNKIPDGFNNNIIWNLGHMIASQQGLCYKRTGVELSVSNEFFTSYVSGSKPTRFITEAEYEEIKQLFFSTLDDLEADHNANKFTNYEGMNTRYNVPVSNIDEAIAFLPFHDGLHIGYIMSLRKLV
jgi:hypothetical protein